MNARQLEIFRALMQTGSVTDAAHLLNVSQPTVSKILGHMESTMGLTLFRRIRGRLHPTPEAEMLFPEADRVFRDLDSLRLMARELRRGDGGTVRIAASSSLAVALLPRGVRLFSQRFPQVRVVTHLTNASDCAELVRAHTADIGLTLSPQDIHTLRVTPVGTVDMVCAMPEDHPLAARATITPDDLEGETLISYPAGSHFGALLDEAFRRHNLTRRIALQTSGALLALAHVAAGSGLAVVDRLSMAVLPHGLVSRPFRPAIALPVNMLTSETMPMSPLHGRMQEALQQAASALLTARDAT